VINRVAEHTCTGDARDEELVKDLPKLGANVDVVPGTEDQAKPDTIQKLVDRAKEAFGGFDCACIRSGIRRLFRVTLAVDAGRGGLAWFSSFAICRGPVGS
jgi:NAD(P)-dependent dehydrogenase (short-subunit alcohol dehydrogenase family)